MFRQFSKLNRKIQITIIALVCVCMAGWCVCVWGGGGGGGGVCTSYVENIVTTVVLYTQEIILYSKKNDTAILRTSAHRTGFVTGSSRSPLHLDLLMSSKAPILAKHLTEEPLKLVYSTQNKTHTHTMSILCSYSAETVQIPKLLNLN